VQDEIARAIADALQLHIVTTTLARRGTRSAAAHESYLKGLYYFHRRHSAEMRRGLEYLRDAVREDPDYAQGLQGSKSPVCRHVAH
jgi:hypothetical protein